MSQLTQFAIKRGFQTKEAEMDLARLVGISTNMAHKRRNTQRNRFGEATHFD